jgi:hypothetical protein
LVDRHNLRKSRFFTKSILQIKARLSGRATPTSHQPRQLETQQTPIRSIGRSNENSPYNQAPVDVSQSYRRSASTKCGDYQIMACSQDVVTRCTTQQSVKSSQHVRCKSGLVKPWSRIQSTKSESLKKSVEHSRMKSLLSGVEPGAQISSTNQTYQTFTMPQVSSFFKDPSRKVPQKPRIASKPRPKKRRPIKVENET